MYNQNSPNKKKLRSGISSTVGGKLGGTSYKTASPYNIKTINMTNGLSPLMQAAVGGEEQVDPTERVYGFDQYEPGDMISEDDLEEAFTRTGNNPKDYPQLAVQDYSEVREDENGRYVELLKEDEEIKGLETGDAQVPNRVPGMEGIQGGM
jgi:hypothetical protein